MNKQRVHLDLLRQKYSTCAETLVRELGIDRQGPTIAFEDYGGEAFKKIVADCEKPIPVTAKRVLHGAAGLVKAALRINRASDEVIAERRAACEACPLLQKNKAGVMSCKKCGCVYEAKIRNADESCPLTPPKWGNQTMRDER